MIFCSTGANSKETYNTFVKSRSHKNVLTQFNVMLMFNENPFFLYYSLRAAPKLLQSGEYT